MTAATSAGGAENPNPLVALERARRSFEAALCALVIGADPGRVDTLLRDGLVSLDDLAAVLLDPTGPEARERVDRERAVRPMTLT